MQYYLVAFLAALVSCTALTPVARWLALRFGAISDPGGRHVNARSIPRLGGPALLLSWGGPLLFLLLWHPPSRAFLLDHERQLAAAMGGGLLLCLVGALDDLRGVRAVHKLLAQVVVAGAAFALGFRIDAISLPFFGTLAMGVFALPVTVLWIVGITNAVNLIDGLDGLAAGISFFAALTSFVVAYLSGSHFVALSMATLMGVLVGFLFFNFNPARIFMGDSGSYFLGYLLATTALAGGLQQKASTAVSLLVPVIALGLPIFDTLFSMLRRLLERRPIFSPDRGHVHHRLLELGLTHRRAVVLLYGVSVVLAAGAIAVSLGRSWEIGIALCSVSVVFIALVRFLGYFGYLHERRRLKSHFYDEQTNRLRLGIRQALPALAAARDEQAVLAVLPGLLESCRLDSITLTVEGAVKEHWSTSGSEPNARHLARAAFPLGRAEGVASRLMFAWKSSHEDPTPQGEVLLQVLVDLVTDALVRVGSSLAPVPAPVTEPVRRRNTQGVPVLS